MTEKPHRSSPPNPPRPSSGCGTPAPQEPSCYDPTDTLNQLNAELAQAKSDLQGKNELIKNLTAAIAALTKTVPEVDDVVAKYETGYDGVLQDQSALEEYRDQQQRIVDCATQGIRQCLEDESSRVDKEITDANQALEAAKQTVTDAAKAADEATQALQCAQKTYDDLKGLLAAVQGKLKSVKDLQKSFQDQEKQGNPKGMYVYLAAMSDLLDGDPQLLKKADFRQQLQDAWVKLAAAQPEQAKKKADLQAATASRDAAATILQSLKDSRIRDKLRRVTSFCTEPADQQQTY
jgi:hypothetical protein